MYKIAHRRLQNNRCNLFSCKQSQHENKCSTIQDALECSVPIKGPSYEVIEPEEVHVSHHTLGHSTGCNQGKSPFCLKYSTQRFRNLIPLTLISHWQKAHCLQWQQELITSRS